VATVGTVAAEPAHTLTGERPADRGDEQVPNQPLSAHQVGPASGKVTALYNGRVYLGNPADIPLTKHAQIQLEVGSPLVTPDKITFPNGL
jgi:hypothetical protein